MQPYHDPAVGQTSIAVAALMLRMGVALLFVMGLIYLTTYALRVYGRQGLSTTATGRPLRLLQTLALGPGRCVHLVMIGKRVLVLSSAGNHVSLLMELSPQEAEQLSQNVEASAGPPVLSHIAQRFRSASERHDTDKPTHHYLNIDLKE